ncbi:coproporphyrinogen III oxidase, partial [Burkholderia multivorans]
STRADTDLIGIGVSSIGKVGDVYAQNAKDPPAYGAALEAGRPPTARGGPRTARNPLCREVSAQMMCNLERPFSPIEAA